MALSQEAAASVLGFAAFGLLNVWTQNAPKLADCRGAAPSDVRVSQQLLDTELYVGGLAVILGLIFAWLSRDWTVLVVMLVIAGSTIGWYRAVLAAESR